MKHTIISIVLVWCYASIVSAFGIGYAIRRGKRNRGE